MASSTITKSLASDVASLNTNLSNLAAELGGIELSVNYVESGGGTKTFSAAQALIIVASSSTNHAIFQCRSGTVITHASAGTSITCTASGTNYTVTNGTTAAARYFAFLADEYSS